MCKWSDKAFIMQTLQGYKTFLEDKGMVVYAIGLKGSQNYNLTDDESDIDANVVFIPNFQEMRKNTTYEYEFETGKVNCHNIYSFAEIVAKGNPQWIEVVNTEYCIGNFSIFNNHMVNPKAQKGMVLEKVAAFSRLYPSRKEIVEKFGYDPKQLHHIVRLVDCMQQDVNVIKYEGRTREFMMALKRGSLPGSLQAAEEMRDAYVEKMNLMYELVKGKYIVTEVDYEPIDKICMNWFHHHSFD